MTGVRQSLCTLLIPSLSDVLPYLSENWLLSDERRGASASSSSKNSTQGARRGRGRTAAAPPAPTRPRICSAALGPARQQEVASYLHIHSHGAMHEDGHAAAVSPRAELTLYVKEQRHICTVATSAGCFELRHINLQQHLDRDEVCARLVGHCLGQQRLAAACSDTPWSLNSTVMQHSRQQCRG